MAPKLFAKDIAIKPTREIAMPMASEKGCGCLSVNRSTKGWNILADNWKVNVINPTWVKVSAKDSFSMGYIDGISDWIVSLSMWEMLIPNRIGYTVVVGIRTEVMFDSRVFICDCKVSNAPILFFKIAIYLQAALHLPS